MTTFSQADYSPHSGKPFELYAIEGWEKQYYYTNRGEPVTFQGKVYEPCQITRGSFTIGDLTESLTTLDLTVPASSKLGQDMINLIARPALNVKVFRLHRDATGFKQLFVGVTASSSVSQDAAWYTIGVKSTQQTRVTRSVAAVYFQNKCNNEFGDQRCKFDTTTVRSPITVLSVNALRTEITIAEIHIPGEFEAGFIIIENQARKIIANDVSTIKIAYPFTGEIPNVVFIQRGCKKDRASCIAYSNIDNFTGFSDIPSTNPAESPLNQVITDFLATKKDDVVTLNKKKPIGVDTSSVKPTAINSTVVYGTSPFNNDSMFPTYNVVRGKYPPA